LTEKIIKDDYEIGSDFKTAVDLVMKVVNTESLSPYAHLLRWSLQLRANSPLCELHRGLARQTLQQTNRLATFGDSDVLVVVLSSSRPAIVLTSLSEVTAMDWTQVLLSGNATSEETAVMDQHVLPGELVVAGTPNASSLVILYGNMDSSVFSQTYRYLKTLDSSVISIFVRSLGAVHYEENPMSAQPTNLAGYGVRLDIKNVE
jgi:hypothetical protein